MKLRMKITLRLLSVANQVIAGESMADIGSDHAMLPCYLISEGQCPWAICGELGDGPFKRSLQSVKEKDLVHLIEVRQGNGLEVLAFGEVSTVVLAGMGGNTIIDILQRSIIKTESFRRLVLQPMNALAEVRQLASSRGWRIERETVVQDGDYYVNLILNPQGGKPYQLSEAEIRWGPVLIQNNREPLIRDYFAFHLDKLTRIIAGILPESSSGSQRQKKAYQKMIKELEDVLEC